MELKEYLTEKAEKVNTALDRLLPPDGKSHSKLCRAMRYSVFAGGKRIRPILVLAACEAVGGKEAEAISTACAFECIHTYSLVHDDLPSMDDDDLRRGNPTCHKKFDEATAILAGDALLTFAFQLISESAFNGADKAAALRVVFEVAHGAGPGGMVCGQMVDIESEGSEISFAELENIHILKTGALLRAAVRSGAIIGGADTDELSSLTRYAELVGLAFQIADDILDVEGSTSEIGKTVGADAKLNKATYPALIGLEESKERSRELVERAVEAISGFGPGAEPLRRIARYIVDRKN